MGKSGKKSKSDKINALRKQYDAFLEEDKKRKDRNKYILGRMETMRSCTALVHVGKIYPKTEPTEYSSQPKYKSTMSHISNSAIALSGGTQLSPKYTKNYDEPSLLREISKKYFLIPKVMSNVVYNVSKENDRDPSPTGDTDWKSKYNILDELKREEKEDQSNTIYAKPNNVDNSYEDNKIFEYIPPESKEKSIIQNANNSLELTPSKPEDDMFTNKELSFNNFKVKPTQNNEEYQRKTSNDENIGVTAELNMEKQELVPQSSKLHEVNLSARTSLENNIKYDTLLISNNEKTHEIKESNELHDEKCTSKMEPIAALENNKYLPEEKNCIEVNESQDNYNLNNANNNLSPISNNENTMLVKNESEELSIKNIEDNQELVRNENTVRAQAMYEDDEDHVKDNAATENTGRQEYQHKETDLNQNQNVEQNITSEVNDELETEQKEMFFSQGNDKTNEYNENDNTTTYPAENENYTNQEYSYYDESQKEQTYPTEINEHEESTERYDPNYEQQYVNNYDDALNTQYQPEQYNVEKTYDQQQDMYNQQQGDVNYQPENQNYEYAPMETVKDAEPNQNVFYTNTNVSQENAQYEQLENTEIDQSDIAYTTSEDYNAQQEYITMHDEPQPIENLEQQLDVEDGYIPNASRVSDQDYQEQVIEEKTLEFREPDIQVT